MVTKTSLTENQKIALGVGAVVLIGGIAYLVLKGQQGKVVTITASNTNTSAVAPASEPILTNGNWSFSQTVATNGNSTVTIDFNNVSTWLSSGTGTTIWLPYRLANYSITQNTTGVSTNQMVSPGAYGMGALSIVVNPDGTLAGIMIQGGTNTTINGTLVITGTVPAAYMPSSATTKTSSGTYG